MQTFEAVDHEFKLWIALLESQCARQPGPKVSDAKAPRFGKLSLNKAKPVYLSELAYRGRHE